MEKMTRLSVNVNKIALLRNSRDGGSPNLLQFVSKIIEFGCDGITLHPRLDERHVTVKDIVQISLLPEVISNEILINVECDLREEIVDLLMNNRVHQFTVVPVDSVEQKTTERGWRPGENEKSLKDVIQKLSSKVFLVLFVEPEEDVVHYAHEVGFHGIELHTRWYAEAFSNPELKKAEILRIKKVASLARKLNLSVHLGHNLSLDNLYDIVTQVRPDEISVGHNLIAEALFCGLDPTVSAYRKICSA